MRQYSDEAAARELLACAEDIVDLEVPMPYPPHSTERVLVDFQEWSEWYGLPIDVATHLAAVPFPSSVQALAWLPAEFSIAAIEVAGRGIESDNHFIAQGAAFALAEQGGTDYIEAIVRRAESAGDDSLMFGFARMLVRFDDERAHEAVLEMIGPILYRSAVAEAQRFQRREEGR